MKVLMVTPYFHPKVGGLEQYALHIVKNLQKKGHDVVVATSGYADSALVEEIAENVRVIRLPVSFKFSNTPIGLSWRDDLKKIVAAERPDIINAHSPVPGLADLAVRIGFKQGIPTVLTYHATSLMKSGSLTFNVVARLYSLVQNSTFKKATAIVAVSDYVKENMPVRYKSKTHVIYNAVDRSEIPKSNSRAHNKNRLIFVGSLDRTHAWKGLEQILTAIQSVAREIPNIELLVLGDGTMMREYEAMVTQLGISENVNFRGQVTGHRKFQLIKSAAALIAYPTTENDAFPTVFPEAWACSTPIVAANIGALTGLLQGRNVGELVEANNPDLLAKAILQLLADPIKLTRYARNGRQLVVSTINWPTSTKQTIDLYDRLLKPQVCMIHNVVSPYRLPVFEEINEAVNLNVIFPKSITKDRVWKFSLDKFSFNYTILNGRMLGPLILNVDAVGVMWRQHPDVLIVNNDPDVASLVIPAVLIAKLRGTRVINWSEVTNNDVDTIQKMANSPKLQHKLATTFIRYGVRRYRHFVFKFSDSHIGFSKGAVRYLVNEGVQPNRITRTRLLMPLENLPAAKASNYKKRTGKHVLYVGYLNSRKGVDTLIRSFKKLPMKDATLTIAGSGPLQHELEQLARDDKRIRFAGYVEGQDKANLYAASDIFVLPTLNDVWGLVIDEAIHYGLAIVCSTAAEAKELVDRRGGVLVPPMNEVTLTKRLKELVNDKELVVSMQSFNIRRRHLAHRTKMSDNIVKTILSTT